jgi:hypothetical protein
MDETKYIRTLGQQDAGNRHIRKTGSVVIYNFRLAIFDLWLGIFCS